MTPKAKLRKKSNPARVRTPADIHYSRAVRIISQVHKRKSGTLNLSRLSDLERLPPLDSIAHVRNIKLNDTKVTDLSPLTEIYNLEGLSLQNTPIADISSLIKNRTLTYLDLEGTKVSDISPLAHLPQLTNLYLSSTGAIDLAPLRKLNLLYLHFSDTAVSDLYPLRGMPLAGLRFSRTLVSDLSPLSTITTLIPNLSEEKNYNINGIWFEGCPLKDPVLLELSKLENPQRSVEVMRYLRKQQGLPLVKDDHRTEAVQLSPPPEIPAQGPGPHFAFGANGVINFAPPEAIDRYGNNVAQLRSLHPILRELTAALGEALGRGNVPHASLNARVQNYRALIDGELETLPFDRLYVEGVRLQNAVVAANEKIVEKELPPFDAPVREALDSLLAIHGTFMMSCAVGLEMIAAEERYRRRPQEEQEFRDATSAFAHELQSRPDIIAPEAAAFVARAAEDIGIGANPERNAIVAASTTKNAAIVVMGGASIGALPLVGAAVAGPAGLVGGGLVALIGAEGLKRSKSFLSIAGIVTDGLDQLKDTDLQGVLAVRAQRLAPYVGFVLKAEHSLRHLANATQFAWIGSSLDWIRAHAEHDKGERPQDMENEKSGRA